MSPLLARLAFLLLALAWISAAAQTALTFTASGTHQMADATAWATAKTNATSTW
ncbi:hypothetical protein [Hymenobacter ginkgonis]|uniref:hypothetical protein n=1 Tax=Hymenobacter ginkgonis TaxID=2682976 RepID=UPI0018DBDD00|nr:hypothetical protein [Hymenobacter ginkgonis]